MDRNEILDHGKWGNLVPVGGWRSMADAIIETLDEPVSAKHQVCRASSYSVETSVDRYLEVLLNCVH